MYKHSLSGENSIKITMMQTIVYTFRLCFLANYCLIKELARHYHWQPANIFTWSFYEQQWH